MTNTKGLVIAAVVITVATTFVRNAEKGEVEFRPFLGAAFMGIFLSLIGMANDRLARNFAMLIILGVLVKDGGHVFTFAASTQTSKKGKHNG